MRLSLLQVISFRQTKLQNKRAGITSTKIIQSVKINTQTNNAIKLLKYNSNSSRDRFLHSIIQIFILTLLCSHNNSHFTKKRHNSKTA